MSLSGLLTFSLAGAQSDGDWFETALEETMRLSSPWELPIMPEFDSGPIPDSSSLAPDNPPETKIVLEVPWGREGRADGTSADSSTKTLVVRLVDDFEDPWRESEEDRAPPVSTPSETVLAMSPAKEEVHEPSEPAARSAPSKEESLELTDPWDD